MSLPFIFLLKLSPYRTISGLIDAHTLPKPTPYDWGDNGVMFFGEYVCILSKMDPAADWGSNFIDYYETVLDKYFITPGLLKRRVDCLNIDGPDNMLGVLASSHAIKNPKYARDILKYGCKNFGFFNQPNPGSVFYPGTKKINFEALLWRQPQLIAAAMSVAQLPKIFKLLMSPLYFYTALVILYSGLFRAAPTADLDSRRLAWLLVQCVGEDSILCKLAAKVWFWGLRKDYPLSRWGQSMRGVAKMYYESDPLHPFTEYWID